MSVETVNVNLVSKKYKRKFLLHLNITKLLVQNKLIVFNNYLVFQSGIPINRMVYKLLKKQLFNKISKN